MTTIVPSLKLFRHRKWGETAEQYLGWIEKRLSQVQFELDNWITVPTNYGIQISHKLEDEKQRMLRIKGWLEIEIETGHFPE